MSEQLIEAMARAMKATANAHVEANNARLAKAGMWPDHRSSPTDETLCRAALTAISEAGYAVVPRDPTEAMIEAYQNGPFPVTEADDYGDYDNFDNTMARDTWAAMLKAAEITKGNTNG